MSKSIFDTRNRRNKNKVTASVRGRVGDDITQCQDDEGRVRNCSNLYIFTFMESMSGANPLEGSLLSGKSSVLQARNRSFVRRGFRRKVPFFLSSTKLSEVVQDIAFDAPAPDCSIQVLPHFGPTVCLKCSSQRRTLFCGLSAQVLHKLTSVVGNVLPFVAFFWHLLFGGSFPSFATISRACCSGS